MIAAVGVDIIEIDRVERVVEKYGDRFLNRVFTPTELRESRLRPQSLAGRFAAKEAVLKVLQTGLARGISWKEVRITAGESGEPGVTLEGQAEREARSRQIGKIHLSISHDRDRAIAFAVGEAE